MNGQVSPTTENLVKKMESVLNLKVSTRLKMVLFYDGIKTAEDFLNLRKQHFEKMVNCGKVTIEEALRLQRLMLEHPDEFKVPALMLDQTPPGLYRVFWKRGGSSLAAVGVTREGGRWLAPINWVEPTLDLKQYSGKITKVELVCLPMEVKEDVST